MSTPCTATPEDDSIELEPPAPHPGDVPRTTTAPVPSGSTAVARWPLIVEARLWRLGMRTGMLIHRLAPPRPPSPSFRLRVPTTLSPRRGRIDLVFYTPQGYRRGSRERWPVIVNFHGGGFVLGGPEDDARWAAAVVSKARAVVVSVGYRRAPENPFPTAVEDGADAMLYLIDHAVELSLDPDRLGTSGFSAGGNMALTATLRLEDALLRRAGSSSQNYTASHRSAVKLIVAWYPPLDYTCPRADRIASCSRPDKTLPAFFTKLFDSSYLHPPRDIMLDSPYLSPGIASDTLLGLLPNELLLYLCRWDMLCAEGERFRNRMKALGKSVGGRTIEDVAHAWDRSPNPLHTDKVMEEVYDEACAEIRRVLKVPSVHDKVTTHAPRDVLDATKRRLLRNEACDSTSTLAVPHHGQDTA
ncbi:alpha/beta-hydrolase [Auriculariales sp. MPI-PUGE-AT-0066]|nr:alpha/beta-hydrolase [Auriculariales sp. MPI-PUGE-AT-0066]